MDVTILWHEAADLGQFDPIIAGIFEPIDFTRSAPPQSG
jgi:hypothetical protein